MAQQLRELPAFAEALGLVPTTHTSKLTNTYSISYSGTDALLWLLQAFVHMLCMYIHTHINTLEIHKA